VYRGW
jgi:hypothetical protein